MELHFSTRLNYLHLSTVSFSRQHTVSYYNLLQLHLTVKVPEVILQGVINKLWDQQPPVRWKSISVKAPCASLLEGRKKTFGKLISAASWSLTDFISKVAYVTNRISLCSFGRNTHSWCCSSVNFSWIIKHMQPFSWFVHKSKTITQRLKWGRSAHRWTTI